jgi:glycosyltransferase involved in cell wall biosynthesis
MSAENIRDAAVSGTTPDSAVSASAAADSPSELPTELPYEDTSALAAGERISAIVPARNEELSISACVDSLLAQPDVLEIIVVDDQSSDRTAEIVRERMPSQPRLRLLETGGVPHGWVGKNHAAAEGANVATQAWLLFMDADAQLLPDAGARARGIANESGAGLISFSPEQITVKWYERALIPFIYCRLAKKFSYDAVNDPKSRLAAANGQFLMIHRSVYDAIGGHASVAGEVLEDVALARRVKAAGYGIRFGPGTGIVCARMYRSFGAMWEGWKKNLYRLIGGTPVNFRDELSSIVPVIPFLLILFGLRYPLAIFAGVFLLLLRQVSYGAELTRNQYPFRLIIYYLPAVLLYVGVLVASYRAHAKGKLMWKGREVVVGPAGKLG